MRHPGCVIAQVINGKAPKLAEILEVSESRCYEILSTDNPSPKTKRLIRAIAQVDGITKSDIRLIKADYDAMFADLLGETCPHCSITDCNKESFEGIQAELEHRPLPERLKEAREAMAAWTARVALLEHEERQCKWDNPARAHAKSAVGSRNNGRGR